MSEQHNNDKHPAPDTVQGVAVDAAQGLPRASASRRRLIKLGAGAVPTALTLASRPVMAWHCNTTSAWGSAVLRNGVASAQARATSAQVVDECWTVANWCGNSTRSAAGVPTGTPWHSVSLQFWAGQGKSDSYAQSNLKISQLFPGGLAGISSTANVFSTLTANQTVFAGYMIVAALNKLFMTTVNTCLTNSSGTNMLAQMAAQGPGVYKPTNGTGAAWAWADIQKYLNDNYIVIAS